MDVGHQWAFKFTGECILKWPQQEQKTKNKTNGKGSAPVVQPPFTGPGLNMTTIYRKIACAGVFFVGGHFWLPDIYYYVLLLC
eukprot:4204700-Lingulodinium_polyedra.AAC.1